MTIEAPSNRFRSLDALRGICALLVALHHFSAPGVGHSSLVTNAWIFVDYFFVLSGFVIAFSYGERIETGAISVGRFMALRFGRIYPLHIALIAVFFVTELGVAIVGSREPFTGPRSPASLVTNILLFQSFGIENESTWNGPSWSIAAEMWTYFLFALVLLAPKRLIPWIAAFLSVGGLCILIASKPSINASYDLGFIRCVYGFGLGFLLYRLFKRVGPKGGNLAEIAIVVFTAAFVALAQGRWTFAAPLVFAVCIYILASGKGAISKLLTLSPFQFLGLVSYSIYMIHVFIAARLIQALHLIAPGLTGWDGSSYTISAPAVVGNLFSVGYVAAVVGCSYATYRLIEKPGRDLFRALGRGPSTRTPAFAVKPE